MSQAGTSASPSPPTAVGKVPASTSVAGALFHSLFSQLGGDIAANGKGLLTNFFNSVIKNPTAQNVVAQGAILAASAPMQLPNLEQESIGQIAQVGLQLTNLLNTTSQV